jgi:hypothetical protein
MDYEGAYAGFSAVRFMTDSCGILIKLNELIAFLPPPGFPLYFLNKIINKKTKIENSQPLKH